MTFAVNQIFRGNRKIPSALGYSILKNRHLCNNPLHSCIFHQSSSSIDSLFQIDTLTLLLPARRTSTYPFGTYQIRNSHSSILRSIYNHDGINVFFHMCRILLASIFFQLLCRRQSSMSLSNLNFSYIILL